MYIPLVYERELINNKALEVLRSWAWVLKLENVAVSRAKNTCGN